MNRRCEVLNLALLLGTIILTAAGCGLGSGQGIERQERRLLVLTDANAPRQGYGPALQSALQQLAADTALHVEAVTDYTLLHDDSLRRFSAVLLVDVFEDSLQAWQRTALQRYLQAGNGVLIADADTLRPMQWHWYQQVREDTLIPAKDQQAFTGMETGEYDGGRIARLPRTPLLTAAQLSGSLPGLLDFLIGNNTYDTTKVYSPQAPEWTRFTRYVLDDEVDEPMQMEILPFGEVLYLERLGTIKMYDPYQEQTRVVAKFEVCTEGNYEDGLHGLAIDPLYGRGNNWIYIYYSPAPCDTPYQYLSRFRFHNGVLDRASEKVMLRVKVQRETCCHSGGALEFGPDGLLYLSTGDNTSSKESDGYTPTDERPGRAPFDAQKGSSNTHDLRGKIIRIRPEADGTYSIPDGNLFPKDGSQGRPEIYTMGCRNPFRIAIDAKTNYLYWGDVGPDVGQPGRYGPQSYDEFNQAREAGNYGWPYFVGNNFAYPDRNFETDEVGPPQDPARPINDSPNNDGSRELPPAKPAMIWYPYGPSAEYPQLGTGSRSAMAGPIYYNDQLQPLSRVAFPDYYNGKMFIYEWARSWIKVVTFDEDHRPVQIEDFMPDMPLSKPIDMKFGPDGALYVIEYGNDYFLNNPDARLVRIEFSEGNRPPTARIVADATAGAVPLNVKFSGKMSTDLDPRDSLRYEWDFDGDGETDATGIEVAHTFEDAGDFRARLVVTDKFGAKTEAFTTISVGNSPPVIALETPANQSFFFGEAPAWPYDYRLTDAEDERNGGVDPGRALVSYTYVENPDLLRALRRGEAELPSGPLEYIEGANAMRTSDCYTCHAEDRENVGPSYLAVAAKYPDTEENIGQLAQKIIRGGNGVWGERLMSAHPQLSEEDAEAMVRYILALDEVSRMPLQGQVRLASAGESTAGGFVIAARYQDKGAAGRAPITRQHITVLRHPQVEAEHADGMERAFVPRVGNDFYGPYEVVVLRDDGRLLLEDIDLKGIRTIRIRLQGRRAGTLEVVRDAPDGPRLTSKATPVAAAEGQWTELTLPVPPLTGLHDLYFSWTGQSEHVSNDMGEHLPGDQGYVDWIRFER